MKNPVATAAILVVSALLLIPAAGFAKPKDRGMNQGEDQATYCKREHKGDEVNCCSRGLSRNLKRSCCKDGLEGIEGEEPICSGGDGNAIWEKKGFGSLGECEETADTHFAACLAGVEGPTIKCLERGDDGECDNARCRRTKDPNSPTGWVVPSCAEFLVKCDEAGHTSAGDRNEATCTR